MSDKKQLPRAGFQLRKKPQQQDDTLIKLYEESELKKKGKAPSAKQASKPKEKDDLSKNNEDVIEKATRKDTKLLAKEEERNAKKLAKAEAKNAKKASKKAKNLEIKPKNKKSRKTLIIFLVILFSCLSNHNVSYCNKNNP